MPQLKQLAAGFPGSILDQVKHDLWLSKWHWGFMSAEHNTF
jgi:hypothetical protein